MFACLAPMARQKAAAAVVGLTPPNWCKLGATDQKASKSLTDMRRAEHKHLDPIGVKNY
jgi:hypothetical protein